MRYTVESADAGQRLDQFLTRRIKKASRAQVREAIDAGQITVDGEPAKPSHKLRTGDVLDYPQIDAREEEQTPEEVDLDILFQDEHLAAINKPPGMVTHPAKGHWDGTLTAALIAKFRQLSDIGGTSRPGIVHRLDRDTSGVLVIAKNNEAHEELSRQFADRETEKEYFAIVANCPDRDRDIINEPIGPHPRYRERMSIVRDDPDAKEAQTFYEVDERFDGFAAFRVFPKTGRTHQIRVHLAHVRHPVLCDRLYGNRARISVGDIARSDDTRAILTRTALHARRLKIKHPVTGEPLEFEAPIPADILATLECLRKYRSA
ncbi:RluA family pseudouridine synthase [Blastopirellula marina]|uniref:Pseudouridine synthase n=1 Tax=Blastopirellula marina TaxID=124 RepID=A0A2S8G0J8_9BACT|nr:RluA family pseudouridine synthase [Blastopirellula marina]PQO37953.1 RluA family pseudouridine synthase [Blastopirellula marina]PTL44609.1 RluA family pseudouridine synthase [Blastopirellula marina]